MEGRGIQGKSQVTAVVELRTDGSEWANTACLIPSRVLVPVRVTVDALGSHQVKTSIALIIGSITNSIRRAGKAARVITQCRLVLGTVAR